MKEDRKWKDSTITNVTGIVHKLKGRFKWTMTGCIAEQFFQKPFTRTNSAKRLHNSEILLGDVFQPCLSVTNCGLFKRL
jgi:hypothetical protein